MELEYVLKMKYFNTTMPDIAQVQQEMQFSVWTYQYCCIHSVATLSPFQT